MGNILPDLFYQRDTLVVARELLGKLLIREDNGRKLIGKIVETEAYKGMDDKANHALRRRTKRNEIMFGKAGNAYVYIIYGMYYCLNFVTEKEGYPAAVLIRAIEPMQNINTMVKKRKQKKFNKINIGNGPGKLCQALDINKKLNGKSLFEKSLRVEDIGGLNINIDIVKTKRIGIDYAGKSRNLLWRFYIKGNDYVSKK